MNSDISLYILIEELQKKMNLLENRCAALEEENVNTTNSIYEIANSLEARIDILATEPYRAKRFTLGEKNV